MPRVARMAEVARRWLQRERERALHDPARIAEIAALRAAGYLVVEVPGCTVVIKRYLSAPENDE